MDAGRLDVLHDADDVGVLPVADGVGLALDGALEEVVEQDLVVRHVAEDVHDVVLELGLVDHDFHPLSAQHVARAHQQREAQLAAELDALLRGGDRTESRIRHAELLEEGGEAAAVLGDVEGLITRAEHRDAIAVELLGELQGRLAAELDDDALRLLVADDVVDVLPEDRLEVEAVGGVAVGGHRLRIAVDHDGLVAGGAGRHDAVDAAVIELDALADAIRTAAEHDHLAALGLRRLVVLAECAVVIRRLRHELRRAGVHQTVAALDAELDAAIKHLALKAPHEVRDLAVSVALELGLLHQVVRDVLHAARFDALLHVEQVFDLAKEPRVDLRLLPDGLHRDAEFDRVVEVEQAVPGRELERMQDGVLIAELLAVRAEAVALDLQRLASLLERLLEAAADAHHLAHGLHLQAELAVAAVELVEVPARNLDDDIVERRLEERAGGARDRVGQLIEVVADGQLRGDLGNRVARGLGRQCGRPAHARVDLDGDDVLLLVRRHRELHIAAAGKRPDGVHHVNGHVAHPLEGGVRQRHRRRHRDGVARVDAHRIEVLDGADDDHIVVGVAEQLELELLPPHQRLVDHHLMDRRDMQRASQQLIELLRVVHHGRPRPTERERRPDAQWEPELLSGLLALEEALRGGLRRHRHADFAHQLAEALAVLGDVDRVDVDPDHLHPVLLPDAHLLAGDGEVQRSLAAHRGQHRIDVVQLEHLLDGGRLERLEVDVVRHDRVGHDGGGV